MNFKFILKANQLAELEKWLALRQLCEAELSGNPDEKRALYYLAISLKAEGAFTEALAIIEPLYSEGDDYQTVYADILLSLESFDSAEKIYYELYSADPSNDFYLGRLSRVNLLLMKYQKAYDFAVSSLKINLENEDAIDIYYLCKQIVNFSGDPILDDSLLEVNPTNPTMIISYVEALLKKEKTEEAYDLALSCLQMYPQNDLVHGAMKMVVINQFQVLRNFDVIYEKYFPIIIKTLFRTAWIGYFGFKFLMGGNIDSDVVIFMLFVLLYVFTLLVGLAIVKEAIGNIVLYFNDLGKKLLTKRQEISIPIIMAFLAMSGLITSVSFIYLDLVLLRFGVLFFMLLIPVYFISEIEEGQYILSWVFLFVLFLCACCAIWNGNGLLTYFIYLIMLVSPVCLLGPDFVKKFIAIYKADKR